MSTSFNKDSTIILASTSAGKSWYCLEHPVCVDGDIIIDQTIGWPPADKFKDGPWWESPEAHKYYEQQAVAIRKWAEEHPTRIILFNGNPHYFPSVYAVVIPPNDVLLRNVASKRDRGVDMQPTADDHILENANNLRKWAFDNNVPIVASIDAAVKTRLAIMR